MNLRWTLIHTDRAARRALLEGDALSEPWLSLAEAQGRGGGRNAARPKPESATTRVRPIRLVWKDGFLRLKILRDRCGAVRDLLESSFAASRLRGRFCGDAEEEGVFQGNKKGHRSAPFHNNQ
jgi:hypothetical protein